MTAVRNGVRDEPGKVTDRSDVRPPTDVMAITSLPIATRHPRILNNKRTARGAVPTPTPTPAKLRLLTATRLAGDEVGGAGE